MMLQVKAIGFALFSGISPTSHANGVFLALVAPEMLGSVAHLVVREDVLPVLVRW